MTILVTGGAGFIGANFIHYWRKHYPKETLLILDALTYAGNYNNIASLMIEPCHFLKGNINDMEFINQVFSEYSIKTVVHFAAESHVDRSIQEPDVFLKTNILGTHHLLKASLSKSEKSGEPIHFHHVSTDEVYGSLDLNAPGFTELSRYAPNSPYSASKAASDHLVRSYYVTYGLPITMSHCSNNYGPYQHQEKLIPLIIGNILHGKRLPVYGTGINVRDWLYVEDHCQALDLILHQGRVGEVYNIGGGREISNIELVKQLCRMVSEKFEKYPFLKERFPQAPCAKNKNNEELISFVTDRKGHDLRYAIDDGKISKELGYSPNVDLEQGLSITLDWYFDLYLNLQTPELKLKNLSSIKAE